MNGSLLVHAVLEVEVSLAGKAGLPVGLAGLLREPGGLSVVPAFQIEFGLAVIYYFPCKQHQFGNE